MVILKKKKFGGLKTALIFLSLKDKLKLFVYIKLKNIKQDTYYPHSMLIGKVCRG